MLIERGSGPRYLATGHLVYVVDGTVLAVRFDPERREVLGGPVSLVDGIGHTGVTGAPHLDMAGNGTLVYVEGTATSMNQLVWVDRDGAPAPIPVELDAYAHIRLSPDERRVVADAPGGIWVLDVERGTRLRVAPAGDHPIWTPDGTQVTFHRSDALFVQPADGSGEAEQLMTGDGGGLRPISWTPDGQTLFLERNPLGPVRGLGPAAG